MDQDLVDIVGMSYYLGELDQQQSLPVIKQIIDNIGELYDKKVLIAETAFPQTYEWSDNTPNLYSDLNSGAWPTQTDFSKQYNWLLTLRETLKTSPYSIGFMYWEPFWVGSNSAETKDFTGSNWENMSFSSYVNGKPTRINIIDENSGLKAFNDPILNDYNIIDGSSKGGISKKSSGQSSKLSFEKSEQPDFKVYVTPKDDNIIVSLFPRAKYNIEVFDLQGKLIHSGFANNVHSHLVYLNKLGFGKQIILIKVTDENGHQQIKKLIVK